MVSRFKIQGSRTEMTIKEIQQCTEFQVFDRKSGRIEAKTLANTIIAFANADGGKIAIGSYKLGKKFGEGVDRMYREMEEAGNPAPEFRQNEFMVYATIRQHKSTLAEEVNGKTNERTSRGQVRGQVGTKQSPSSH